MYGMKVKVKLNAQGRPEDTVLRNVTEVHYNYKYPGGVLPNRVAFESDIHGTGITYSLSGDGVIRIVEFEVTPETEMAEAF